MATKDRNNSVHSFSKGLNTDFSPQVQPEDSYRFALNAVNESETGDTFFVSNEESNAISAAIPTDTILIGSKYIGDGNTVVFLVSKNEANSYIGIFSEEGKLTIYVDDSTSTSTEKLNFSVSHQIDCTYRLRKGCERTIYFTDNFNPPRYYNFDKDYNFKDDTGKYKADLFRLFRVYKKTPIFSDIRITENGILPAGSYNIAVQYVDSDLNPTEWMTVSDTISIYNDATTKEFSTIRGSSNLKTSYQDFGPTAKSIIVSLENLDTDFPYYRLALIQANSGTGLVSKVSVTQEIPTDSTNFIFTGNNTIKDISEDDVLAFDNDIEKAAHIEQLENMLLLANTEGKDIDWWRLQKYASKIKTDVVLENVILNSINDPNNPKNGNVRNEKVGYMPGEIYSIGIVYVFEDGKTSPVFHIPGKNPNRTDTYSFSTVDHEESATIKGMRKTGNSCATTKYVSLTDKCVGRDYWGVDERGDALINTPVRHHRFPLRSEINKTLVNKDFIWSYYEYNVYVSGTIPISTDDISIVVTFNTGGNIFTRTVVFKPSLYTPEYVIPTPIKITAFTAAVGGITIVSVVPSSLTTLTYSSGIVHIDDKREYNTDILGLSFSDIELPPITETNGNKIVGYYIVRNERTEENKTILDSAILLPMLNDSGNRFLSHGLVTPCFRESGQPGYDPEVTYDKVSKHVVAVLNPEFKFNNKEYKNYTAIQEGYFWVGNNSRAIKVSLTEDVQAGTSYDPDVNSGPADNDGFTLRTVSGYIDSVEYVSSHKTLPTLKEAFYLNALTSSVITDKNNKVTEVYNISSDNKIGVASFNDNVLDYNSMYTQFLPYVVLKSNITEFYPTFRVLPYHRETPIQTEDTCQVFHGDSYVNSMKYTSSIFYDNALCGTKRKTKESWWKYIAGGLLALGGVILIATGVGVAAGVMMIGAGVAAIASGIETDKVATIYGDLYKEGLRDCVEDGDTIGVFGKHDNPIWEDPITWEPMPTEDIDDEIRWFMDVLKDIWFESSVNISLRQGNTVGLTDFIDAPTPSFQLNSDTLDTYFLNKLTVIDSDNKGGRLYKGYAGAELYEINKDFYRINKQKPHFALGMEYDCCSKCSNKFPQRIMYSQQSFQEELTDNYRVFLPNNYRDIDGETGEITNMFKIQNSLFLHTKEALWNMPKNYQERVTGQLISFLGTGSFFDIPPQKIVDDANGNSAGTNHKWGSVKTQYGYFFVCENQNCIFQFDGKVLDVITDSGIKNDIYYKIPVAVKGQLKPEIDYINDDNVSNPLGTGFIVAYDSKKDRILFTKKDFIFKDAVIGKGTSDEGDFMVIFYQGTYVVFLGYKRQIDAKAAIGVDFEGFIGGKMTFADGSQISGVETRNFKEYEKSWTISYSLKSKTWVSWHSYMPNHYFSTTQNVFSWKYGSNNIWKHNIYGNYQNFYGTKYPFVLEFVSADDSINTRIWDSITLIAEAKKWVPASNEFVDQENAFFNKVIFYNSKQCSGELTIVNKNENMNEDYMSSQISTPAQNVIFVDRNERNWTINQFRDFRSNYTEPIFKSDNLSIKNEYFTDKVINTNSINFEKDWTELESFRDKYLVVRLKFDTFDDVKLLVNYSIEEQAQSFR